MALSDTPPAVPGIRSGKPIYLVARTADLPDSMIQDRGTCTVCEHEVSIDPKSLALARTLAGTGEFDIVCTECMW